MRSDGTPSGTPSGTRSGTTSGTSPRQLDWGLRFRVRVGRRALDREIAEGARVDASPLRTLRARQLSRAPERGAIAAALVNILDAAEECKSDPGARLTLDHEAVIAARGEILALIRLLRSDEAVDVRRIACARLLVEGAASLPPPASAGRALQRAVSDIVHAS